MYQNIMYNAILKPKIKYQVEQHVQTTKTIILQMKIKDKNT